jgi:hypothetical protein
MEFEKNVASGINEKYDRIERQIFGFELKMDRTETRSKYGIRVHICKV